MSTLAELSVEEILKSSNTTLNYLFPLLFESDIILPSWIYHRVTMWWLKYNKDSIFDKMIAGVLMHLALKLFGSSRPLLMLEDWLPLRLALARARGCCPKLQKKHFIGNLRRPAVQKIPLRFFIFDDVDVTKLPRITPQIKAFFTTSNYHPPFYLW